MRRKVLLVSGKITVEKGFEYFQDYNSAKNLSDRTIRYYDDCFKYFRRIF